MRILPVLVASALFFCAGSAKADYFVWRDVNTGLSLSFPDTWQKVNNADREDVITVAAPSGQAHAQCRVRALEDRRHLIYPPELSGAIQKMEFSTHFWSYYLNEYENGELYDVYDGAGLGRGFAGYAVAGYKSDVPGADVNRKALMFASLYNDTLYILECSARREAFHEWNESFLSIAKSIDFRKTHHELKTGHHRDFLEDERILFRDEKTQAITVY